jgi:sporulation protein YlmC with PRC-barrel domain
MGLLTSRHRQAFSSSLSGATSLCAQTLIDSTGDVMGSIVDVLLDLERGRVAYALVACGGFVGVGERMFAVPWTALQHDGAQFVLNGNRSLLESGPSFDREHWSDTPEQGWHERVHAHFHARPFWDESPAQALP